MKRFISVLLALLVVFGVPRTAMALDVGTETTGNWWVRYSGGSSMGDNFTELNREYASQISRLQPGDSITFVIDIEHTDPTPADWYMRNFIAKTLEELRNQSEQLDGDNRYGDYGHGQYSAYGYHLEYNGPVYNADNDTYTENGQIVLYDSEDVGGDASDTSQGGLTEATVALENEEYLYLTRLRQNDRGSVTIKVTLDGETEGNAYFDTLAKLKIGFAVEPVETAKKTTSRTTTTTTTTNRELVRTGDDTDLLPLYIAMVVSGFLFLALAYVSMRERRREREGQL